MKKPTTKATPKKAAKPKPRTIERETVGGKFGSGEEAAKELAHRVFRIVRDGLAVGVQSAVIINDVKAELLGATSVTETLDA